MQYLPTVFLVLDLVLRLGLSLRVIMRRQPVGVSLAWLGIILLFPFVGAAIYLLIGETRLGNRRAAWAAKLHKPYEQWLLESHARWPVEWNDLGDAGEPIARLAAATVGVPVFPGNQIQLLDNDGAFFDALIADINRAERTVHLEFYIWQGGGRADEVSDALCEAVDRGVTCRVLLDAVGSYEFLGGRQVRQLRKHGVALQAALPVGIVRMFFDRLDLRLHRKIVVIDGQIGYTGSNNLADPEFFKRGAGVGQWIDAMARLEGPAVEGLGVIFLEDWELDSGEGLEELSRTGDVRPLDACGESPVQVVPSGPLIRRATIEQVLLMAIYSARRELVLTTPYFVPDESMLAALTSAAQRGVDVTIVLPTKVDSRLVRLASQASKGDLLEAGVRIAHFDGGLLHTKSITIDGETSLFGSLNLDPRSLRLNFEVTLVIYDPHFTKALRGLQTSYIDRSHFMELETWQARAGVVQFVENAARLLGPLL